MKMTVPIRSASIGPLLSRLDSAQREAALHNEGPAIWLAGPGAGKTGTIVARVGRLICEGTSIDRILCTTFSVAGAEEMRKRIAAIIGMAPDDLRNTVSTFHSQALRFLTQERSRLPWKMAAQPIIQGPKAKRILRQFVPKERVGSCRQYIAKMRRQLITPDEAVQDAGQGIEGLLALAYRQYDEALCDEGVIDFDAMVYWAVKVLEENQFARAEWEGRYRYVVVDEAHDTSADQEHFARLLAAPANNITFVGDRSQSIYGFRGAETAVLNKLEQRMFYLGINYRSAQEIIDTFRPLCEQDEESQRLSARMQSANPNARGTVEYVPFADEMEQGSAVADLVAKSIFAGKLPDTHAVLSRTRALLAYIADELEYRGLPYRWSGKNFWLSSEVQDILGFVKLAVNPKDDEAVHQVICSSAECTKFLGQKFADAVLRTATYCKISALEVDGPHGMAHDKKYQRWMEVKSVLRGLWRKARMMPPKQFIRAIIEDAGLEKNGGAGEEPDEFRAENILAVIARASRFSNLKDFLAHAEVMAKRTSNKTGVVLSTIHGSKGLEWDSVFVIGVAEDVIPHEKSDDAEEERRILYVALSRARRNLTITWHKKPSPFLNMIIPVSESEKIAVEA